MCDRPSYRRHEQHGPLSRSVLFAPPRSNDLIAFLKIHFTMYFQVCRVGTAHHNGPLMSLVVGGAHPTH